VFPIYPLILNIRFVELMSSSFDPLACSRVLKNSFVCLVLDS
jgi:hypothetical protein